MDVRNCSWITLSKCFSILPLCFVMAVVFSILIGLTEIMFMIHKRKTEISSSSSRSRGACPEKVIIVSRKRRKVVPAFPFV